MKSKGNYNYNLRIPGPTPLPPKVLKAISRQMINHRGPLYEKMQKRVIDNLKYFFQTRNDVYLLTSSGMGGLEAAIVNFFSAGDKIVSFTCGDFGNRWADVARAFSADVFQVNFAAGKAVDKDEVYRVLESQPDVKGVLFTLNETATGVLNKISDFIPFVHTHRNKPLLLIDAVSALGAVDFPMDELGVDVLVSASQKAWMAPPGIAMISLSAKARDFHRNAKMPRYYFDLSMYRKFAEKNQTPATCAVSVISGLDAALEMMRREGREKIFSRHRRLTKYLRKAISGLGLELFVEDEDASPTVTSIIIPEDVDGHRWLAILAEKYNCILAGGMGETKGKIIRVAHMGWVDRRDIDGVIQVLKLSLKEMKYLDSLSS